MSHAGNDELKEKELEEISNTHRYYRKIMSYDYGDYLYIRDDKVIAVSGNTEFYDDDNDTCVAGICPCDINREHRDCLEYVDGDVIVKVVQVGQYIKENKDA